MKYFSNEIVFRGHPDKVCDQISDALLTAYMKEDKNSRCGIEVAGGKGKIFITGEVTSAAKVDVDKVTRRVLKDVGYPDNYEIINNIGIQSKDIALGTNNEVGGAGDNGMMFGYACADTQNKLPKAMVILQEFARQYDFIRKNDKRFKPDGKAQITGEYYEIGNVSILKRIKTFTICYQNTEEDREYTDNLLRCAAIKIAESYGVEIDNFLINPTGRFEIGGFEADAGLTGRKIVVDNYQSFGNVGGGAFSGKDPTKVDRSGAYKAREIAKRYLDASGAYWCEVQLSYAIGKKEPLAIYIRTDKGTIQATAKLFEECQVQRIIEDLNLKNKDYEELARFGHFTN